MRLKIIGSFTVLLCLLCIISGIALEIRGGTQDPPPTVALFVRLEEGATGHEYIEDLLVAELSSDQALKLVERSVLELILKEQELNLGGLANHGNAIAVGKLAGANLLIITTIRAREMHVRLLEVSSGKVLLEKLMPVRKDLLLNVAAIREEIFVALRIRTDIAEQVTVGIGTIYNISGTPRADKVGDAFHKKLRTLMRKELWAAVLERLYPEELLAESGLGQAGLTEKDVSTLPPADMVISGKFQEAKGSHGEMLSFVFDVTSGRGKEVKSVRLKVSANRQDLDPAVTKVVKAAASLAKGIQADARQLPQEFEAQRLRSIAFYLMPRNPAIHPSQYGIYGYMPKLSNRGYSDVRLAIRAFENVLLLDPDDVGCRMALGVCLQMELGARISRSTGLNWFTTPHERSIALQQLLGAADLIGSACHSTPTTVHLRFYVGIAEDMVRRARYDQTSQERPFLRQRAGQICKYIVANRAKFDDAIVVRAERLLVEVTADPTDSLREAIAQAAEKPRIFLTALREIEKQQKSNPDKLLRNTKDYTTHPHPLVRHCILALRAKTLLQKGASSCMSVYTEAVKCYTEVPEPSKHRWGLPGDGSGFYEEILKAAKLSDQDPVPLLETAWRPFIDGAPLRTNLGYPPSAHLLAEAYDAQGHYDKGFSFLNRLLKEWPSSTSLMNRKDLTQLWEIFRARRLTLAVPDMSRLVPTPQAKNRHWIYRMIPHKEKLWMSTPYKLVFFMPGETKFTEVKGVTSSRIRSIGAVGDVVLVGTYMDGAFLVSQSGQLIRHIKTTDGILPSPTIVDICSDEDNFYILYVDGRTRGVARLTPDGSKCEVLSPNKRDASRVRGPGSNIASLFYYKRESTLYVSAHQRTRHETYEMNDPLYRYKNSKWKYITYNRNCLERRGECLWIKTEEIASSSEVQRVEFSDDMGKTVFVSEHPAIRRLRAWEWDDRYVWLVTDAALYEIDKATGKMGCVALMKGLKFTSVCKLGPDLYVGTSKGLYRLRSDK